MSQHNDKNNALVYVGVGLIALGAWWWLKQFVGWLPNPVQEILQFVRGLSWPAVLILIGIGVVVYSKRNPNGVDLQGKRLYRSRDQKIIAGVCGGLGEYFGFDPVWLRVLLVLGVIVLDGGPLILAYIVGMIVIPEAPKATVVPPVWPTVQPPTPPAPPKTPES